LLQSCAEPGTPRAPRSFANREGSVPGSGEIPAYALMPDRAPSATTIFFKLLRNDVEKLSSAPTQG